MAFVRGTNNGAMFPVPAGTSTMQLMHSTDWFPTLGHLAGYDLNGTQPLDGVDQWGVIARGDNTTRTFVVHNSPAASVTARAGAFHFGQRWKVMIGGNPSMQVKGNMVQTPPPGFAPPASSTCPPPAPATKGSDSLWLFDVVADPRECTNLADSHPTELKAALAAFDTYRTVRDIVLWPRTGWLVDRR